MILSVSQKVRTIGILGAKSEQEVFAAMNCPMMKIKFNLGKMKYKGKLEV